MATEFGRFVRKLRVDHDEVLKDMANKLEVSSSFLSSLENGRKKIPESLSGRLIEQYGLNQEEQTRLFDAVNMSNNEVKLNLTMLDDKTRTMAVSFARRFEELDDEEIQDIIRILRGDEDNNG